MSTLLDRMKLIMEEHNVKPKQVTDELSVSVSSFTDWGKGKGTPSVAFLSKFATRFNVSLDYLVFGTNNKKLEFSNPKTEELVKKFNSLTPEYQTQLIGYIDGILSAINNQT